VQSNEKRVFTKIAWTKTKRRKTRNCFRFFPLFAFAFFPNTEKQIAFKSLLRLHSKHPLALHFFNPLSSTDIKAGVFHLRYCYLPLILHPKFYQTLSEYSRAQQGLLSPFNSHQDRSLDSRFAGQLIGTVGISLIHSCASLIR